MSAWLLLVREVHAAGGRMLVRQSVHYNSPAAFTAREYGLLEQGQHGRQGRNGHVLQLTPMGHAVAEGRLRKADARIGRWHATWLAALPVGVRLTPAVQRAEGSNFW